MKFEVAKNVNRDFDTHAWEALETYVQDRVTDLHKFLETAVGTEAILKAQGAIQELRNLLRLKENTKSVLEQARK